MIKKIVSTVLIPLLLLQLYSCYSMDSMSKSELLHQPVKADVRITTYQLEIFEFKSFNYEVRSDTLIGIGRKILDKFKIAPFTGKIAIKDIESVEANKLNIGTTCLVVSGVAVILASIYGIIVVYAMSNY